jgi:hypothetical protein
MGVVGARQQPENRIGWLPIIPGVPRLLDCDTGAYLALDSRLAGSLPLDPVVAAASTTAVRVAFALRPLPILLFPEGRLPSARWCGTLWTYLLLAGWLSARPWPPARWPWSDTRSRWTVPATSWPSTSRAAGSPFSARLTWLSSASALLLACLGGPDGHQPAPCGCGPPAVADVALGRRIRNHHLPPLPGGLLGPLPRFGLARHRRVGGAGPAHRGAGSASDPHGGRDRQIPPLRRGPGCWPGQSSNRWSLARSPGGGSDLAARCSAGL